MSLKSSCYLGIVAGLLVGALALALRLAGFTHLTVSWLRWIGIVMYISIGALGLVWMSMRNATDGALVAALGALVASGLGLLNCFGDHSYIEVLIGYAALGFGHGFIARNHLLRASAWLLGISALLLAALTSNAHHGLMNAASVRLAAIAGVALAICLPALGLSVALAMHRQLRSGPEAIAM